MRQEIAGWCALCKSRCGATFTVEDGRLIDAGPLPSHPTGRSLCVKGKAAPEILYNSERLLFPQKRTKPKSSADPGWERISWDEALAVIGEKLRGIRDEHGPQALSFSTTTPSGTGISDGDEWIDRLIRMTTPNWVSTQESCTWHRDTTHRLTVGSPLPYPDWEKTDLVVLWGFNPSSVWLDQATQIAAARARGAKVMVVDPRRFGFAIGADHWLRVRPGADGILMLGLMRRMIETGRYDREFVQTWTNGALLVRKDNGQYLRGCDISPDAAGDGFVVLAQHGSPVVVRRNYVDDRSQLASAQLLADVDVDGLSGSISCRTAFGHLHDAAMARTLEQVSAATWVPVDQIVAAADGLSAAASVAYYTWTGLCQHATATQTDRALATLMSLKGCYDVPGGNIVLPAHPINKIHGEELLDPDLLKLTVGIEERPIGPPSVGRVVSHDFYTSVLDGVPYKIRALVGFGSNLAVAHADSIRGRNALAALDFYVHCDIFENPSARYADILLPVNTFYERDALRVGFTSGKAAEEHVQFRPKIVEPMGESRSDAEIAFSLADELGLREQFFGGSIDAGRDYVIEPLGIDLDTLKAQAGGVQLPLQQRYRKYCETNNGKVNGFKTETGLVELYSAVLHRSGEAPVPTFEEDDLPGNGDYPFALTSAKTGYFCHSQHRNIASLRKREPDPYVYLAPETADELMLDEGDWADIVTAHGWIRMRVKHDKSQHPKVVRAAYGWWQGNKELGLKGYDPFANGGANFNVLMDGKRLDRVSGSAPHRSISCKIVPVDLKPQQPRSWSGYRPFIVNRTEKVARDVTAVWLSDADGRSLPDYHPGQHIAIRLTHPQTGEQLTRCYSLVGSAIESNRKEYCIAVRRVGRPADRVDVADGRVSNLINDELHAGQKIDIRAPSGTFVIPLESDRPLILVAGGIGITPMLSYLETLALIGTRHEVRLVYANRSEQTEAYAEKLKLLQMQIPLLTVHRFMSEGIDRPTERVIARRVKAQDILNEYAGRNPQVYFCGPPSMTSELRAQLKDIGHDPALVYEEAFSAAQVNSDDLPEGPFNITFAKSAKNAIWTREKGSLLDLAETVGVAMANGCRAGQCESCEVRILAGECRHRISIAHPGGETCLACQTVPTSDLVVDA
ncbi:molybdopterin-dependent oxidoreductase [Sinorhizobium meliloti]|uniref:molybdopterin-dependent oxidoreductase n=1 Tax=Rhizobium meliloti TaxID=382 RepID=UPI00398C9C81